MSIFAEEELDFEPDDSLETLDDLDNVLEGVPSPTEYKNGDIIILDSDIEEETDYSDYICDKWTETKKFNITYTRTNGFIPNKDEILLDSTDDEEGDDLKMSSTHFKDCNININFDDAFENIIIKKNVTVESVQSVCDIYAESTETIQSEPIINRVFFTRKPWTTNVIISLKKIKSSDDIFQHFPWDENEEFTQRTPPSPPSDTISLHVEEPMEVEEERVEKIVLPVPGKTDYVRGWIQTTTSASQINFSTVPSVFSGLCYKHFFNNNCTNSNCSRKHVIGSYLTARIFSTDANKLLEIYQWTKDVPTFREQVIDMFISGFAVKKFIKGLVQIIEDSFQTHYLNEKDIISTSIHELKERAFVSIQESIKSIILGIGIYKYPTLGDIIMEIISEFSTFEGDWDCINLISYARETEFNYRPILNIISKCANYYPVNMNLLKNLSNLVERRLIDVNSIPDELLLVLKATNSPVTHSNSQNNFETRSLSPLNPHNSYLNGTEYPNSSVGSASTTEVNVQTSNTEEYTNTDCSEVKFGQPKYNSRFVLNKSLHNLYPNYKENATEVFAHDINILNDVIQKCDGERFLQLLEEYKDISSVKSFIRLTIDNLKLCKPLYIYYHNLLTSIKQNLPNFMVINTHKAIFEVITLNLLYELEKRNLYKEAAVLLCEFNDWDSLLSSLILSRKRSHMGRYIYLSKIFIKTNDYSLAYRVLANPHLKLLEKPNNWPYSFDGKDLIRRNKILKKFFEEGYHYDVIAVTNLYRIIFNNDNVYGYDFSKHLDGMFEHLLNEKAISVLKLFYDDLTHYYKRIKRNNLRAFTILILSEISEDERMCLYEKCAELHIYKRYDGTESTIDIRTDLFDAEIQLILKYFLLKLKQPFSRELSLIISFPFSDGVSELNIFKDCIRSVEDVNASCARILIQMQMDIVRQEVNLIKFKFNHRITW